MPINIEIKARATDFDRQLALARRLADTPGEWLDQEDTFFGVPHGRLKLRVFASGRGELIFYQRPDSSGPKPSRYLIAKVDDPVSLKMVLQTALGVRGVVRKRRFVAVCGTARIHLDDVADLGRFLELEIVLEDGLTDSDGEALAADLMQELGIRREDLVTGAYLDLLAAAGKEDRLAARGPSE